MNIETEFRKGIFFVRLNGKIDKNSSKNLTELFSKIDVNGFKNIVFNIENLTYENCSQIRNLFNNFDLKNNIMLCGLNNINIQLSHINIISDELSALQIVNI